MQEFPTTEFPTTIRRLPFVAAFVLCLVLCTGVVQGEDSPTQADLLSKGKVIYEKSCAVCHGEKGEGVETFETEPLVGDLPIGILSEVITETMPEDDPEACLGSDALAVASYIHEAFYSEATRLKLQSPRVGLSRLTKTQLRQSLADLYAYRNGAVWSAQDHGLKGRYYDDAGRNNKKKKKSSAPTAVLISILVTRALAKESIQKPFSSTGGEP